MAGQEQLEGIRYRLTRPMAASELHDDSLGHNEHPTAIYRRVHTVVSYRQIRQGLGKIFVVFHYQIDP